MGVVFGKISEELPRHSVVTTAAGFTVRHYEPSIAAVAEYGKAWGQSSDGSPFGHLARYIGVFSQPENMAAGGSAPEAVSMTAPVLINASSEKHSMMFLLPASKYASLKDAPTPSNPGVHLEQLPARHMAVRTFSGNLRPARAREQLQLLLADLKNDGRWVAKPAASGRKQHDAEQVEWAAAGYNAPFVLPWFKTNEVLVTVEEKQ